MTSYPPDRLLSAFLDCIETQIIPLTAAGVLKGSKVFGAAVLRKSDLSVVVAQTNDETGCPLWHGEVNTIRHFYSLKREERPSAKECVFLTTHEPCSLCLSAIVWGGFDNFSYLFSYEDTRDAFDIPHDLDILHEVFRVPAVGVTESKEAFETRPEYNRRNRFFLSQSFAELVKAVEDPKTREALSNRVADVKGQYTKLSEGYQNTKGGQAEIPLA